MFKTQHSDFSSLEVVCHGSETQLQMGRIFNSIKLSISRVGPKHHTIIFSVLPSIFDNDIDNYIIYYISTSLNPLTPKYFFPLSFILRQ